MGGGRLTAEEIIHNTRVVLLKNIILTEELEKQILKHNIIGETTFKEIKACSTNQDQNEKLLDHLIIRGRNAIQHFCDALQLSGFNLLSDMLREQLALSDDDQQSFDISDLNKRAPRVFKALDTREKEDLTEYVKYKVHEGSVKGAWQGKTVDKEKAMAAKQKQLEENWKFTEMIKAKDETITQMSNQMEATIKDAESKGVHLKHVNDYLKQIKKKHEEDMKVQMQYNQANDKSLRRQTQTQKEIQGGLNELADQIDETLTRGGESTTIEAEQSDYVVTPMDRVNFSIQKLFKHTTELQDIRKLYENLSSDCAYVVSHLGKPAGHDIRQAFQDFIVDNDEHITELKNSMENLRREFDSREKTLKEQCENSENRAMDLQNKQEEMMSNLLQKDAKIKELTSEVETLRNKIAQLENSKQMMRRQSFSRRPSTPHFMDYGPKKSVTPHKRTSPVASPSPREKPLSLPAIKKDRKIGATRTHEVYKSHSEHPKPSMNGSSAFIVQSIGHSNRSSMPGKTQLQSYQNTYGKQQASEMQTKKGVPYYR